MLVKTALWVLFCSPELVLTLMASMLFALVVTNPFEVRLATLVEMVFQD